MQAVEEGFFLLAPGTEAQHLCKELRRRLLGDERRQDEELLYPLDVCQLVRSQRRRSSAYGLAGDQADRRLRQDVQAILEPGLLVGDVAQPECPVPLVNQARWLAVQNGGSLTALFAGGTSSGRGISRCSMLLLCVLKSVLPNV
jgi:hypothetical protein